MWRGPLAKIVSSILGIGRLSSAQQYLAFEYTPGVMVISDFFLGVERYTFPHAPIGSTFFGGRAFIGMSQRSFSIFVRKHVSVNGTVEDHHLSGREF